MNILYICPDYGIPVLGRKGASVHVRQMIAAFSRAGHRVQLISPVATKSPWDEAATIEGEFIHLPLSDSSLNNVHNLNAFANAVDTKTVLTSDLRRMLYDRQLSSQLLRRYTKTPPDIIYTRASLYSVAALDLAKATSKPLLVELNAPLTEEHANYRSGSNDDLAAAAERKLLRGADHVFVVSNALKEHAINLGVKAENISIAPNGIDPAIFFPAKADPEIASRWGLGDGPVLGFVGGLREWHGVEILPKLLQRVRQRFNRTKLAIIGSGPLQAKLENDLAELGLRGEAIFTGALLHHDVAGLLRHFNIALAPYPELNHNFYFSPLKLFEYMACGIPVVAAKLGQIVDVVDHGTTGLLYQPGNLDALTSHCNQLLDNPKQAQSIGLAGANHVHGKFTWDNNARQVFNSIRGSTL